MTATKAEAAAVPTSRAVDIHPNAIVEWVPENLRAHEKIPPKDPAFLELVESIRNNGVLQPVIVKSYAGTSQYLGVIGSRRTRAALAAGVASIPAIVRDDLEGAKLTQAVTIENLQREDLPPLLESEQLALLFQSSNVTIADVTERIGKDASYIRKRLQLQHLTDAGKKGLEAGTLQLSIALMLARLTPDDQATALPVATGKRSTHGDYARYADDGPVTTKEFGEYIKRAFLLELAGVPWDLADETLVVAAGSCKACPKRTGNAPDLWGDAGKGDRCTDGACFDSKKTAFLQLSYAKASAPPPAPAAVATNGATADKAKPGADDGRMPGRVTVKQKPAAIKPAPKPIPITLTDHGPNPKEPTVEKPLGAGWFSIVKGKTNCPDTVQAFIVEGDQAHKAGSVIAICRNMKCRIHNAGASVTRKPSDDRYTREQRAKEKAIKRERIARQAVLKAALYAVIGGKPMTLDERKTVAIAFFGRVWNENRKHIVALLEIDAGSRRSLAEAAVKRWLGKATPAQVDAFLLACAFAPAAWLSSDYGSGQSTKAGLEAFAKRKGVNVAKVRAAAVADKKKAKAERKAAKGKAK
jgi:ParB/RepB/Spo0J family partition protein